MDKNNALEIIKETFNHLIYDENLKVGTTEVLLHFPSIGIALLETSANKVEGIENLNEHIIRKELNAKTIYLDLDEPGFNIGWVINEILLEAGFVPTIEVLEEGKGHL